LALVGRDNRGEVLVWAPSSGWRPTWRTWLSVLALGLVFWLIVRYTTLIFEVAAVLFAAYLMSLAISPLADFCAQRHIPRAVAVLIFYALAAGLLVLIGRLLVPVIHAETMHLRRTLPAVLERALAVFQTSPLLQDWLPTARSLAQGLTQGTEGLLRPAVGAVMNAGGVGLDLIVVLVLAFFFVTDDGIGERLLYGWIPAEQQPRVRRFSTTLRFRLTRWLWAQVAVAVYFALAFSTVLTLLHVPFAFTIGIIGGLLELVPYLGGFVAFSLAALSALSTSPITVLWIAILYVVVIQTEGHVLAPALYGRVTGLHPASVLLALFVGAKAAGLLGVIFAVPVAVVIVTLLEEAQRWRAAPSAVAALPAPESELEKS
jgi:predicted PurR-regulated permease PerM